MWLTLETLRDFASHLVISMRLKSYCAKQPSSKQRSQMGHTLNTPPTIIFLLTCSTLWDGTKRLKIITELGLR